jgi:hypothetical protein
MDIGAGESAAVDEASVVERVAEDRIAGTD